MSRGTDKPFGFGEEVFFETSKGAYSVVTKTESGDSQITLTGREKEIAVKHFGVKSFLIGARKTNPKKALKNFKLHPKGNLISVNLGFSHAKNPTELRLYLKDKKFRPEAGDVWFLFEKGKHLWIGSMKPSEWSTKNSDDPEDDIRQKLLDETAEPKKAILRKSLKQPTDEKHGRKCKERSDYKCEYDSRCKLFTSRATGKPYVEPHHLIPISCQKSNQFKKINLDHPDNLISLCPSCHKAVHLSIPKTKKKILTKLYSIRREFQKYKISLDNLLDLYELK